MIFDFVAIGLVGICIGVIVFMIAKKFPIIASINVQALDRHKQEKVKQGLMEDRLKRKLAAFDLRTIFRRGNATPAENSTVKNFYNFLKNLETRYRNKITAAEPEEQETVEKKKMILLDEAKELTGRELYKEAEGKYIEAISLDRRFTDAYEGLAELYMTSKDYVHAKEIYQYLLKMNVKTDSAYQHLGNIAAQEGNLPEAEHDYLQSISLNTEVAGYHTELGEVYLAMQQPKKALQCFEDAVKLEPNNPRHLDVLIKTALVVGDKATAETYYKKLKEVNPENEKLKEYAKGIKEK